ncbi:MAG: tetratricopeptide repeat protein [Myxococcota bacterium]
MGPVLLSAVATAALSKPLLLHPSEHASVVVLPRASDTHVELGVYHNRSPIGLDVATWRAKGLDHARVVDTGGGTMFVMIELVDPNLLVRVVERDSAFEVQFVPGTPRLVESRPHPTIEALFDGMPRRPAPAPEVAPLLTPLIGDARTFVLPPEQIRLDVPQPGLRVPDEWADWLGPVEDPTWADIDRWRGLLPGLHDPDLYVVAMYRLGDAHRRLGLAREAAYYFGQGAQVGFPPAAMFLARADAALSVREWESARGACEQAWYRDAPEELVVQCLGVLSLATNDPPPAETGRALGAIATLPVTRQLAGELLLRDGYPDEAIPLLRAAVDGLDADRSERAWVALGDAYVATGEVDLARRAYLSAPHRELGAVIDVRELMMRMVLDGVRRWPAWVPALTAEADRGGPAGADALYLLAQVHERYVDYESASNALARLWDQGVGVQSGDVPARLLADCGVRIAELDADRRDAELVAMYDACWRDGLGAHVADVGLLDRTSHAWERLGLREQALEVQLDLTRVLASVGREDPAQLGRLAHLQVETEHPERALETIAYARRLTPTPLDGHRLDLVVGEAYAAMDRTEEALAAWTLAAESPELADEVTERTAVHELEIGRCGDALPKIRPRVELAPLPGYAPGELELLVARCDDAVDRPEDAIAAAGWALSRATDDPTKAEAKWFATAVGAKRGVEVPKELTSDGDPWASVAHEDATHAAWKADLAAWERGGSR